MMSFIIGLDTLLVRNIVLHMLFLIIMQKSKLIHTILCPQQKILALHNVIILFKSLFNKDQNHYYYNMFLEKCSYQLPKTNDNK